MWSTNRHQESSITDSYSKAPRMNLLRKLPKHVRMRHNSGNFTLKSLILEKSRGRPSFRTSRRRAIEIRNSCYIRATNNEVGYEALVMGLCLVRGMGTSSLKVICDSKLVVNQVKVSIHQREIKWKCTCPLKKD